jgi:hypothetical protein
VLRTHVVRSLTPYDPAKRREMRGHDPDVLIMGYSKLRGWGDHLAGKVRTVIFDEAQELRRADSAKYTAAAQIADAGRLPRRPDRDPGLQLRRRDPQRHVGARTGRARLREEFAREWCGGDCGATRRRSRPGRARRLPPRPGADDPAHPREVGRSCRTASRSRSRTRSTATATCSSGSPPTPLELAELIVAGTGRKQELWRARGDFDWKLRQATGVAKAPYVAEFVKLLLESEQKVILFGWHRAVYDIWAERLAEFEPVFYTGRSRRRRSSAPSDAFLTDDACRVFVMSLRSGAGLDGLQHVCKVGVFGELDWSPAMHDQCIGRYARDGQQEEALAYFLVSDHGADPVMAEVLKLKRQQQDPLRDPDAPLFREAPDVGDRVGSPSRC